jgi:hypothetical protein
MCGVAFGAVHDVARADRASRRGEEVWILGRRGIAVLISRDLKHGGVGLDGEPPAGTILGEELFKEAGDQSIRPDTAGLAEEATFGTVQAINLHMYIPTDHQPGTYVSAGDD